MSAVHELARKGTDSTTLLSELNKLYYWCESHGCVVRDDTWTGVRLSLSAFKTTFNNIYIGTDSRPLGTEWLGWPGRRNTPKPERDLPAPRRAAN